MTSQKYTVIQTCLVVLTAALRCVNVDYPHTNTSAPRHKVLLLGTRAFYNLLNSIKIKIRIGIHATMVEIHEQQFKNLRARQAGEDEDDVEEATRELKKTW